MELRGRVLPEAAHLGYSISIVEILKIQRLLIIEYYGLELIDSQYYSCFQPSISF